jgi:uncharacterized protein (TIGR04255 family)
MTAIHDSRVSPSNLPGAAHLEFGNPPVGETSLGFYFERIDGWNVLHHGAIWERFRKDYPDSEFLPLVIDAPLQSGAGGQSQPSFTLNLSSPAIRVGFVDKTRTKLVQMQNGFFLHNWRKTVDLQEYQRYETVKSQLRQDWTTLRAFLQDHSLKQPVVLRCQMDYFNHIGRGEDWQDFSDLPNTFTVWRGIPPSTASGKLQMVSFNASYRLESGTVNVVVQPAIRSTDGKEIVQLIISSSITPANSEDDELFACLDKCHANASLAFLDFTTAEARERWKQKK